MRKVGIVTDSLAGLPRDLVERHEIRVLPVSLAFSDRIYLDEVGKPPGELYKLLENGTKPPTTAPPSPGAYLEAFREMAHQHEAVLCITVSQRLSSAVRSAEAAKALAQEELPEKTIHILDSGSCAMGQGFVVLEAARAAEKGQGLEEVLLAAQRVKEKVYLLAFLDTLKYLARSGRIPTVGAWAAAILSLKPIIRIDGGRIGLLATVRDRERGMERLLRLAQERSRGKPIYAAVIHANVPEHAQRFREMLASRLKCAELLVAQVSPVMGIFAGPSILGLAFYTEGEETLRVG